MMQNGIVYPLPPLVLSTDGTEYGLLPTPAASDWKGSPTLKRVNERAALSSRGVRLPEHIARIEQVEVGKNINPVFVEWLMGFPENWTELSS